MPQITKVRIANFQYNNGNRIIADELFNFECDEKAASDVLINLLNGGGKSVLVQLMMQPVIPKAKIGGRKVEGFFTKSTDHCYIVLEWALDNSKMKLLTGIAMAASDTAADAETERGFHIKYYTFRSEYQDNNDEYSITNLPLSRKEKGRFVPAVFDDIRNLAKKSNGRLVRFSSEDNVNWRDSLSQYGIIQSEWRMAEKLNAVEGGLSDYFKNLKTSDAVVDDLIIPVIEDKQSHTVSKDDSSLETMLIAHAKNYSKSQSVLKEREVCKGFLDGLNETKLQAEALWQSSEALTKCISELFAFSDALANAVSQQEANYSELNETSEKLRAKLSHIAWEEQSADYYTCKDKLDKETENLTSAEQAMTEAKESLERSKKQLTLTECAHYYEQLVRIKDQIEGISLQIKTIENDAESGQQLAILKYSALCAVRAELQRLAPIAEQLKNDSENLKSVIETRKGSQSQLSKDVERANKAVISSEAKLDINKQNNDRIIEELGIDAIRWFDGRYHTEEFDKWKNAHTADINKIESDIRKSADKMSKLRDRQDSIPQEIADKKSLIDKTKRELEDINAAVSEYTALEAKIKAICTKYSLNFAARFTAQLQDYLTDRTIDISAEKDRETRALEADNDELSAAKQGTLHIPQLVAKYLSGSSIRYTSFESYILAQQEKGLISAAAAQQLLDDCPYAAYGVIADKADIASLREEAADKWLPAALPVFTPEDVNLMLQGEYAGYQMIAAYAKDYFRDKTAYIGKLEQRIHNQQEHLQLLQNRIEELTADRREAEAFSGYDEDWLPARLKEVERLENRINKEEAAVDSLEHEKADNKEKLEELQQLIEQLRNAAGEIKDKLKKYDGLIEQLQEEDRQSDELASAKNKLKALKAEEDRISSEIEKLSAELEDVKGRSKELNELNNRLQDGLSIVGDACETAEDKLIAGEWSSLLLQYQSMLDAQSKDLSRLNADRDKLLAEKKDKESEIAKRNCSYDEYAQITYSAEQEQKLREAADACGIFSREKEAEYYTVSSRQAVAKDRCEQALNRLAEFGGEPLPVDEVGSAFAERRKDIEQQLTELKNKLSSCRNEQRRLEKAQSNADYIAENYTRPLKYEPLELQPDYEVQLTALKKDIAACDRSVESCSRKVRDSLGKMKDAYGAASTDIGKAVSDMLKLLTDEDIQGDRYYTLNEHIDANIHTVQLRISQIDTDLREFNRTKDDIIRQCVIQGKQMHEGLIQLSNNSKVKVQDKRCQMLRFDIPETIDDNAANAAIASEIDKGTIEIAAKLNGEGYTDAEIRKIASRTVGSRRLLRKYIGRESISLKAYKIDSNPANSGYRTWEQTQVNNSGAEKFVVYFAIILALMTYARDNCGDGMDSRNNSSVLVLDNPFGPITSQHVLQPMFEISRRYNVQMICLSDIDKTDVRSCFRVVIKAIVKRLALSSKEQLTHDENEMVEHGYYKSEQIELF